MEYPEISVDKKCPKCEGRMGYYETELDDGDICWCFNDAAHPFFEVVENIFDDKITGV